MNSFNFHDIMVEKANAISRYQRIQRVTTLFRLIELFAFLIIVSRFSVRFVLPLKLSGEYFRDIFVTLMSPRVVFLVGNAIVIVLFLISGRFSARNGEELTDFYDEYVERCRKNQEKKAFDAYKYASNCYGDRKIHRRNSENTERTVDGVERRRQLTRSMTERCRRSPDCEQKLAAAEEMSNEEFRRTVEAFIARQQRFLREEEELPAVVSVTES